jgi:hypothetical protein
LAWIGERGDEVKICEIDAKETGAGRGDGAIEEELGGGEIGGGSVGFALVVDKIAADCPANAIRIRSLRAVVVTNANIGWFLAWGQLVMVNGFSSFDRGVLAALCQTSDFFGTTSFPFESVDAFEEMAIFFELSCCRVENSVGVEKRVVEGFVGLADLLVDEMGDAWWKNSGNVVDC